MERMQRNAMVWSAIALFLVIALVFLLVAAHTGLTYWVGPVWAPLIIAGAALIVAAIVYIVARIAHDIAHRREAQRREAAESTALITTAAITALPMLLNSPLMKTIGLPLGGALAAAFFLSRPGGGKR